MSGYVRLVKFTSEIDGQQLTVTLTPLLFEDLLQIRSAGGDQEAFVTAMVPILRKHVVEMTLFKAEDGTVVELADVLQNAYFTRFIIDAALELVRRATPANP